MIIIKKIVFLIFFMLLATNGAYSFEHLNNNRLANYDNDKRWSYLYKETVPSVAYIRTLTSNGSGVFIEKDLIITNNHVIAGTKNLQVEVITKNIRGSGVIVYTNPSSDIALIRVTNLTGIPIK